jgi:hypothetical protein
LPDSKDQYAKCTKLYDFPRGPPGDGDELKKKLGFTVFNPAYNWPLIYIKSTRTD